MFKHVVMVLKDSTTAVASPSTPSTSLPPFPPLPYHSTLSSLSLRVASEHHF